MNIYFYALLLLTSVSAFSQTHERREPYGPKCSYALNHSLHTHFNSQPLDFKQEVSEIASLIDIHKFSNDMWKKFTANCAVGDEPMMSVVLTSLDDKCNTLPRSKQKVCKILAYSFRAQARNFEDGLTKSERASEDCGANVSTTPREMDPSKNPSINVSNPNSSSTVTRQ